MAGGGMGRNIWPKYIPLFDGYIFLFFDLVILVNQAYPGTFKKEPTDFRNMILYFTDLLNN